MVYSTCRLEPEENIERVESWVKLHPQFKIGATATSIPPQSGMDGAFAAALVRT
jgi:16S rRNA (cytosine967-C5)-methyltransferase